MGQHQYGRIYRGMVIRMINLIMEGVIKKGLAEVKTHESSIKRQVEGIFEEIRQFLDKGNTMSKCTES
jgi:uncharacterized protein YoxC